MKDEKLLEILDRSATGFENYLISFDGRTSSRYSEDFQHTIGYVYQSRLHLVPALESRLSLDDPARALLVGLHMAELDVVRRDLAMWTLQQLWTEVRGLVGLIAELVLFDLRGRFPADPSVT